jgi:hypothetical protein
MNWIALTLDSTILCLCPLCVCHMMLRHRIATAPHLLHNILHEFQDRKCDCPRKLKQNVVCFMISQKQSFFFKALSVTVYSMVHTSLDSITNIDIIDIKSPICVKKKV